MLAGLLLATLVGTGCKPSSHTSKAVIEITSAAPGDYLETMTQLASTMAALQLHAEPDSKRFRVEGYGSSRREAEQQVGDFLMALAFADQQRLTKAMRQRGRPPRRNAVLTSFEVIEGPGVK